MALGSLLLIPFTYLFSFFSTPLHFPMCSRRGEPVKILFGDKVGDVDVANLFNLSKTNLGKGGFGVVRQANWETKQHPKVAIKRVEIKPEHMGIIRNELVILDGMKSSTYFPSLIACVQDENHLFMVQELIEGSSLAKDTIIEKLSKERPKNTFPLIHQGFKAIESLFKQKITHNDIKPENVLIDKTLKKIYLIDCGLASFIEDPNKKFGGTPGFIAPGRFLKSEPKFFDDMYSWTLAMAEVLGGTENLFAEERLDSSFFTVYEPLDKSKCFKQALPKECQVVLMKNVSKIFKNTGFGELNGELNPKKINLTSLLTRLVEYNNFKFTLEEFMGILARIESEIINSQVSTKERVDAPKVSRIRQPVHESSSANVQIQKQKNLIQREENPKRQAMNDAPAFKNRKNNKIKASLQNDQKYRKLLI